MSFTKEISMFGVKTKKQIDFFVYTICTDIATGLSFRTPADTGRARANWFPSLDSPITTTTEKTDKGGQQLVAATRPLAQQAAGRVFYLSNNLPYIRHLEYGLYGNPPGSANGPKTIDGFSSQAVGGFVRVTINEVVRAYS